MSWWWRKHYIIGKERKGKQKLITVSPSSESVNTFGKKDLISFMKVTMKMNTFKCQKIIQVIKKVTEKFLTFFRVKILVMNSYLKNYKTECFIYKQPTRGLLQKYMFCKNLFWNVIFLHLWPKPWKVRVKEFIFSNVAGLLPAALPKNELLYT